MKSPDYSVDELVEDPSFCRMAMGVASEEEVEFWCRWMQQNERNRNNAREALTNIAGFSFAEPPHRNSDIEGEWDRLYHSTIGKSKNYSTAGRPQKKEYRLQWIYRIGAVILLGCMIGLGFYLYEVHDRQDREIEQITRQETVTTGEREQKTLRFSSGAKVVLNRNSSLTYTAGTTGIETIEVVLDGEAFFDVEPSERGETPAFAVRTPDGLVKDIGTEFLVTVQGDRSRVILQEGRVEVESLIDRDSESVFRVDRGEAVEFSNADVLSRKTVNSTLFTSWATGFMEFEQTSIQEFADYIEHRFGVEVQIADRSMAEMRLDGAIYFQSLEELVRSVSEVTDIVVYRSKDGETVYIGNPHEMDIDD